MDFKGQAYEEESRSCKQDRGVEIENKKHSEEFCQTYER
jgi:hypothetical protein